MSRPRRGEADGSPMAARGFLATIARVVGVCVITYYSSRALALIVHTSPLSSWAYSSASPAISTAAVITPTSTPALHSTPAAAPDPSTSTTNTIASSITSIKSTAISSTATTASTVISSRTIDTYKDATKDSSLYRSLRQQQTKSFIHDVGVIFSVSSTTSEDSLCEMFSMIQAALPRGFPVAVVVPHGQAWLEQTPGSDDVISSRCGLGESSGFSSWSTLRPALNAQPGLEAIRHVATLILCLRLAPSDWRQAIWANFTALEQGALGLGEACVLTRVVNLQSRLTAGFVNTSRAPALSEGSSGAGNSGTRGTDQQRVLLWPPGVVDSPLSLQSGLEAIAVLRATPAASASLFPWLSTFADIYIRHATRSAFPLLQVRHALAEACVRHPESLVNWLPHASDEEPSIGNLCDCVTCNRNFDANLQLMKMVQSKVDAGHDLKSRARRNARRARLGGGLMLQLPDLYVATELYEARYEDSWTQCDHRGGCRSSLRKALSEYDPLRDTALQGHSPFAHRSEVRKLHLQKRFKVVVVTASSLKSLSDKKTMAMMANKQAYAEKHGYVFELGISDVIVAAEGLRATATIHFKGEFCKILVLLSSMRRHVDADWFMMADHDVWLHPMALKEASLDPWLLAVPPSKLFVHSNYHSLNTGIVLLRQGEAGRELVMKWWAVANSSLIECHSWDQAAAQLLFLGQLSTESSRIARGESRAAPAPTAAGVGQITTGLDAPFNFTCKAGRCGNFERQSFWSCDKAYRDALKRAFDGSDRYATYYQMGHFSKLSTHHQATIEATDFHVLRESASLPRLQCMHCQTIDAIDAPWGFNKPTMSGALNGWFVTHKAFNRFAEYFTDVSNPHAPFADPAGGKKEPPVSAFKERTTVTLGALYPVPGFGFSSCPEPHKNGGVGVGAGGGCFV